MLSRQQSRTRGHAQGNSRSFPSTLPLYSRKPLAWRQMTITRPTQSPFQSAGGKPEACMSAHEGKARDNSLGHPTLVDPVCNEGWGPPCPKNYFTIPLVQLKTQGSAADLDIYRVVSVLRQGRGAGKVGPPRPGSCRLFRGRLRDVPPAQETFFSHANIALPPPHGRSRPRLV